MGKFCWKKDFFNGADNFIFPGGRIQEHEMSDFKLAAIREAQEELGITPTTIIPVLQEEDFKSEIGKTLRPFVVTSWEGDFPEKVLDTDAPLVWQDLDEVMKSPLMSVSTMAATAKQVTAA